MKTPSFMNRKEKTPNALTGVFNKNWTQVSDWFEQNLVATEFPDGMVTFQTFIMIR